jgi:hypothetical protein
MIRGALTILEDERFASLLPSHSQVKASRVYLGGVCLYGVSVARVMIDVEINGLGIRGWFGTC